MNIDKMVNDRIDAHIKEHEGLYSEKDLVILRPIWFDQLKKDALQIQ